MHSWLRAMLRLAEPKPVAEAPVITTAQIDATIVDEKYHVFPGTTVTVCCLILANGQGVVGESACVSPARFNKELGRRYAREDAKRQIWKLEGYLLRQRLEEAANMNCWNQPLETEA